MKGHPEILKQLNKVLTQELTSINQYFLHARMFRNWGLERLNEAAYKKSILDMKQADRLIERILFLEGLPNLQKLGALRIGEDTSDIMACDIAIQHDAISQLRSVIAECESQEDFVSRELLVKILEEEEEHLDWLESQEYLITNTGLENYLQAQIEED